MLFGPVLFALLLLLGTGRAHAVVLDWSNVSWTAGSLTGSFDIDSNNAGNDVTITITGNTSQFFSSSYPQITDDFTGGLGSGTDQLDLYVDFSNTSQSITVTVTFHYAEGVQNVGFTLFDIDTGNTTKGKTRAFVDQVRNIHAIDTTGKAVAPTITVSDTDYTQKAGSGTNQTITGRDVANDFSGEGSASISFGSTYITNFTFTYGEGSGSEANPFAQGIGLYDISYQPKVPEFHPGLAGALVCLLLGGVQLHRSRAARDPMNTTADNL